MNCWGATFLAYISRNGFAVKKKKKKTACCTVCYPPCSCSISKNSILIGPVHLSLKSASSFFLSFIFFFFRFLYHLSSPCCRFLVCHWYLSCFFFSLHISYDIYFVAAFTTLFQRAFLCFTTFVTCQFFSSFYISFLLPLFAFDFWSSPFFYRFLCYLAFF